MFFSYLCIAKRVTGHGVNSNILFTVPLHVLANSIAKEAISSYNIRK